jgi:hypothetical protein
MLVLLASVMFGMVWGIARIIDQRVSPPRGTPIASGTSTASPNDAMSVDDVSSPKTGANEAPEIPVAPDVTPGPRRGGAPLGERAKPTMAPSAEPLLKRRDVSIRILVGWANITLDGVPVASNVTEKTVPMTIGKHTLVFSQPKAKTRTLDLDVQAGSGATATPQVVEVAMEPQPARLALRVFVGGVIVDDAWVTVEGQGAMPSSVLRDRPLTVPLRNSVMERQVSVMRPGSKPYQRQHTFRADEETSLDIALERAP